MLESIPIALALLIGRGNDPNFLELKNKLETYGFQVRIEIPPSFRLPELKTDIPRRSFRKPYGVFHPHSKSIWINPIVFDLGNSQATIVHEAVHAAQYCKGKGKLESLGLDIEPISQASPFFKRYTNIRHQALEKEAYTVQSQTNSVSLALALLDRYCQ